MKKILAFLTLIALFALLAIPAQAQMATYDYQSLLTAVTPATAITNSTARTPGTIADVRRQSNVSFRVTVQCDAADTSDLSLYLAYSDDGINFDTTTKNVPIPMTGVTKKTIHTNILTYGCGYIKLVAVTNAAASAIVTNCAVGYAIKTGAP